MATRCKIEILEGGREYTIYRHCDGYPAAVLADIKKAAENGARFGDAEYFLANFIFLAKYNFAKQGYDWRVSYGVCAPTCRHGDLEYIYTLWYNTHAGAWMIKISKWRRLENGAEAWVTVFDGELEEAFKRFITEEFRDGCHIKELP